jgi:catechol 2,3-dioxygenase-like lactoylglutathione lyase family enzyme
MSGEKISAVHHVGITVDKLDDALLFWESFLGCKASARAMLDRPYLGEIVGMPGVSIEAAFVDLPSGVILELAEYRIAQRTANPSATSNPGNIHICLEVGNADIAWRRAVDCGAAPVRREGPVEVDEEPNKGARVAFLRIHDGVTLELLQRAPAAQARST